jgi:hypothetical protein
MAPDKYPRERPRSTQSGEVSVNLVESAGDSVDLVFDELGLPEPSPAVKRITPKHVAEAAGVPTPDDLSDEMLRKLDEELDIKFPRER